MRVLIFFLISTYCISQVLGSELRPPYMEIHMVIPPKPIKWGSPKKLFWSTLANSWYNDYAPNGHYMVYLVLDRPNKYGVKRILTGMSRTDKMATVINTLKERIGFSALEYEFNGKLDAAEGDIVEIAKSRKKDRIFKMSFQLDEEKSEKIQTYLENFIKYGSFKHYGGNMNTAAGEGAGCADFAMVLMNYATDGRLPFQAWVQDVYVPKKLMKIIDGKEGKKVRLPKLMFTKLPWAKGPEDGVLFSTPDPDMMGNWVKEYTDGENEVSFSDFEFDKLGIQEHESASLIKNTSFSAEYEELSPEEIKKTWKKIALKKPLEEAIADYVNRKKIKRAKKKASRQEKRRQRKLRRNGKKTDPPTPNS